MFVYDHNLDPLEHNSNIKHETQSNLTVASLLGELWWVSYFRCDTFLKMITLPSKVKNDDVILRRA